MSARMHFLCKRFIAAVGFGWLLISSVAMTAQTASPHVPLGIVSDWSHRHLLYPNSNDIFQSARIQDNPRWVQNWYLRHPEAWRLGYERRRRRAREHRDWSVPLGTAYFEPLFDSTFTFVIGSETGNGTLTTTDLGSGELLATAGTLNVTGGSAIGSYPLYPGGPAVTTSPAGAFLYDNLFFPTEDPALDGDGLLFTGGGGLEINIWGNGTDNYSFYTGYSSGNYPVQITAAGVITPNIAANPDPGGGQIFPAKFVFDVTEPPSCTNDFVVIGIPTSPAPGGQANILGLNNLYSNSASTGYCPTNGPTVMFAYASGTGQVPASVVLSQSGQQIAYVENLPGRSYFHVLTIGTTGSNGAGATASVAPGSAGGNNAVDTTVLLSPDGGTTNQSSTTAAFVVYTPNDANDVAYVTTYSTAGSGSGYLYKIGNVFNGTATPTIVWSAVINAIPSTAVYDQVSNQVFFTDSSGRIDYVTDTGMSPPVVYGAVVANGTTSENPVVIDTTHQTVYASFNSNGTNALVVQAPTSMASSVSVPVGTANTTYTAPYLPDFNNAFYTGSGTPMMFVAGTGTGTLPTLYGVGFNGSGVMNTSATSTAALATGAADSSPVSEFYNPTLGEDFLFVAVTDNCVATIEGGTSGCVMSLNITGGFPTVNANSTALAASGGASGMIPDNDSNLSEASSIYYATKTGTTLVKATQSGLD
jgi:hypothetical protein